LEVLQLSFQNAGTKKIKPTRKRKRQLSKLHSR